MFCMCIEKGCVGIGESKLCPVSVLAEGTLVQGRVRCVLYVYGQRVRWYRGEKVVFRMCIDRGCVGTGDSKLCPVCVLTEGALVQGRVSCVLYVY